MSSPSQPNPLLEPVPQLDLAAQYAAIGSEIRTAVERVCPRNNSSWAAKAPLSKKKSPSFAASPHASA